MLSFSCLFTINLFHVRDDVLCNDFLTTIEEEEEEEEEIFICIPQQTMQTRAS